jgi:hypothetical protein
MPRCGIPVSAELRETALAAIRWRQIFSRFDKLDLLFIAFIYFALIIEGLQ